MFKQIVEARKRRFMTDALPHLLLYLAGISSKDYDVLREKQLKELENGK